MRNIIIRYYDRLFRDYYRRHDKLKGHEIDDERKTAPDNS